jgi:hypothetical protein
MSDDATVKRERGLSGESLTERHLLLFGTIVQWFARYERLMVEAMARLAGVDSTSAALMTRELRFEEKRRAFLNILRYRKVPIDQYDRVCEYLRVPHALGTLRDNIVHATWAVGRQANSVQPDWVLNVPPNVQPSLGGVDAEFIKGQDEKVGYTLDDLAEAARTLSLNYAELASYVREVRPTAAR